MQYSYLDHTTATFEPRITETSLHSVCHLIFTAKVTRMSAASESPTLVSLPEEIQAQILLNLNAIDLLACRKVCRCLAGAIDTIAVQYKIELDIAGMVDGPPGGSHKIDRLHKLRQYYSAWNNSSLQLFPRSVCSCGPPDFRHPRYWPLRSGGVFMYSAGSLSQKPLSLYRPSSTLRGVDGIVETFRLPSFSGRLVGYAVDAEQDLLAVCASSQDNQQYELHLLSVSRGGLPHPRAEQCVLYGIAPESFDARHTGALEICGEIVAWKVWNGRFELQVWNWNTGMLVWRNSPSSPFSKVEFRLLSSSYLLLFDLEEHRLCVHSVDKHHRGDLPESADSHICALNLPPTTSEVEVTCVGRSMHIGGPMTDLRHPLPPSSHHAPFFHDPANTLVALHYSQMSHPSASHTGIVSEELFLLLVPISTIMSQVQRCGPVHSRRQPPSTFTWDEWGPHGSRLVPLRVDVRGRPTWISSFGSRCAIVYTVTGNRPRTPASYRAIILDIHPCAAARPVQNDGDPAATQHDVVLSDNIGQNSYTLASSVSTTLPFRLIRREFDPEEPLFGMGFTLTEDGLALIAFSGVRSTIGVYGFSA